MGLCPFVLVDFPSLIDHKTAARRVIDLDREAIKAHIC